MGYGRAMVWGAMAGVLVIVLAAAAVVWFAPALRSPMTVPGDRTLVVIASRDGTQTGQVAQLVGVADTSGGGLTVQLVDPLTTVTVAGTGYDRLADAYPFGGGTGVARAYASASGGQPLPVIALTEAGLVALVDRVGGLTLTIPSGIDVFDGTKLYTFPAGPQKLTGVQVVALLSAIDFNDSAEERATMRAAIAGALAEGLAGSSADLSDFAAKGLVSSSLKAGDLGSVGARIQRGLPNAVIKPSAR